MIKDQKIISICTQIQISQAYNKIQEEEAILEDKPIKKQENTFSGFAESI